MPYVTIETTRKSYVGCPMTLSHFSLSDFERLSSRSLEFGSINIVKELR